ncbi:MAG: hypothetical protein WBF06_14950 [Candidatus Acidiferrales bacterium]
MNRSKLIAPLLVAGLASVAFCASAARAAAVRSPAAQTTQVATLPAPHPKRVKFHGGVVNQSPDFITVRSLDPNHPNELRTFTFSPQLKPKMQRILDAGGYQNGDKVVVTTLAGSKIALDVRGRPSKPA